MSVIREQRAVLVPAVVTLALCGVLLAGGPRGDTINLAAPPRERLGIRQAWVADSPTLDRDKVVLGVIYYVPGLPAIAPFAELAVAKVNPSGFAGFDRSLFHGLDQPRFVELFDETIRTGDIQASDPGTLGGITRVASAESHSELGRYLVSAELLAVSWESGIAPCLDVTVADAHVLKAYGQPGASSFGGFTRYAFYSDKLKDPEAPIVVELSLGGPTATIALSEGSWLHPAPECALEIAPF